MLTSAAAIAAVFTGTNRDISEGLPQKSIRVRSVACGGRCPLPTGGWADARVPPGGPAAPRLAWPGPVPRRAERGALMSGPRRDGCPDVAVVEPRSVHHYRPLLSYVASGTATLADLRRPQDEVVPSGVRRYAGTVASVDPARSVVVLADGTELGYGDLAVCPGSEVDWDAVPGSREAVANAHDATSYLPEQAEKTWTMLSSLRSGR